MGFGEEVAGKTQALGETGQHVHAQAPGAVFEVQHDAVKLRYHGLVRPQIIHVRQGDLEGFLLVGGAGRGAYLRHELPAGVQPLLQREAGFLIVRQGEEGFGQRKGALHQLDI